MADTTAWFEAQDEQAECDALATAFGLAGTAIDSWSYGCLEDSSGDHMAAPLVGPLYCSTSPLCPLQHLTTMDQMGVSCADPVGARRSICPCE